MSKNVTATSSMLEQHPLALQLVPGTMPENEFAAFCEDIKKRGQRHKIIKFEDKVLDGMHRYRACLLAGLTPLFEEYTGDDAAGLVISLNVMRRKLGTTQRALAGARLNIDYGIGQDDASKRVGVSKLHVNLVCQALKSKNARVLKLLENPDLTREQLYEELVESGIMRSNSAPTPVTLNGQNVPGAHLNALFAPTPTSGAASAEDLDDLLGSGAHQDNDSATDGIDLDDVLGEPPSANGQVITFKGATTPGGNPVVGGRVQHPERRNEATPGFLLAEKFKALPEVDRISFMQIAWPLMRPLIVPAGLSAAIPTKAPAAETAPAARAPSKATSAQATKAAAELAAAAVTKAASTPATGAKPAKGTTAKAKAAKAA